MQVQDDSDFGDFSSAFPSNDESLEWGFGNFSTAGLPSDGTIPDIPPLPEGLDFGGFTSGEDAFLPVTSIAQTTSNVSTQLQQTTRSTETVPYNDFEFQRISDSVSGGSTLAPGSAEVVTSAQNTEQALEDDDWDEFGRFEAAVVETSSVNEAASEDPIGEFSKGPDMHVSGSVMDTVTSPATMFVMCFASSTKSDMQVDFTRNGDTGVNFSWLSKLKKSIDFTVPLYKWDTSYLQSCYYTSIKVDPILITKTDMTSVTEMLPVVEGQSAAVDLMESFGFEGGIEPSSPTTNPDINFLSATATILQQNHSGPTLLDLSLPNSPSEELQNDSFTLDADLQGLDLHSTETERQTTSIEQLLLNEKLVINRTTWMDSELEQLGVAAALPTPPPSSPRTEQCKETAKKASFQEQLERLGLDTSKTTLATKTKPAVVEMSISARLVFDRLPNLSFMLEDTLVPVEHQFY